jgi:hypothetical protein
MATHAAKSRSNVRGVRELGYRLEEDCRAPAGVVYDLLSDVRTHLEWGGRQQPKKTFRLLSVEAPEGIAGVGTEFRTTGADAMGTFADSSVVTEASRPGVFEFVTESRLQTKRGVVGWTNVHRYEVGTAPDGCRISYGWTGRFGGLPGALALFKVPGLRSLGLLVAASNSRRGLRNLARMAEARSDG